MKVVFVGDSPAVSTGFSRCTKAACDALHAAGHEVIVLGINHPGDYYDPATIPYPIFRAHQPWDGGHDAHGAGRLPVLLARHRPDIVCILQDPWNIKPYFDAIDKGFEGLDYTVPPIAAWLAVDSKNQFAKPLNRLASVAVWTQFAGKELEKGGYHGPWWTIPLGVDHQLYYPRDKAESRRLTGITESGFFVGVVGRNQHRKRLDLVLEAFAEWINEYDVPDAYLLMHVAPTGDVGVNIRALSYYYGLTKRVILSEPKIGVGVVDTMMPHLYSSMDVFLSMSQAEGWNLPALEAMACGVPCVLPDFAAHGEHGWVGDDEALLVPCPTSAITAPMNTLAYTIGGIPDREHTVDYLDCLYRTRETREFYANAGMNLSKTLDWAKTGSMMVSWLESVHRDHVDTVNNEITDLADPFGAGTSPTSDLATPVSENPAEVG